MPKLPICFAPALTLKSLTSVMQGDQFEKFPVSNPSAKLRFGLELKIAVTDLSASMVIRIGLFVPVTSPLQPENVQLVFGLAARVTWVPTWYLVTSVGQFGIGSAVVLPLPTGFTFVISV